MVRSTVGNWRYVQGAYQGLYEEVYAYDHRGGTVTLIVSQYEPGDSWVVETVSDDYNQPMQVYDGEYWDRRDALDAAYRFMQNNPGGGEYATKSGATDDFMF